MDDLMQFLRDRLDEDEEIAREAGERSMEWRLVTPLDDAELGDAFWLNPPEKYHAERHDPARVLREVEAKRQLLEKCRAGLHSHKAGGIDGAWSEGFNEGLLEAVKFIALAYKDRPGYREEWRP